MNYIAEVKKWLREYPGHVVTSFQVAKFFGQAYLQAATMPMDLKSVEYGHWIETKTEADFIAAEITKTETTNHCNWGSKRGKYFTY